MSEKQEKKQRQEDQERVKAYLAELNELDKKHGLCLVPILNYGSNQIKAAIEVQSFEVIEPKKAEQ
jgi:hypothetical protein